MFIYHYHAFYSTEYGTTNVDGIATCKEEIIDMQGYLTLKKYLAKEFDIPVTMTLTTLVLLHKA